MYFLSFYIQNRLFLSVILLLPVFSLAAQNFNSTKLTNNDNRVDNNTIFFKTNDQPFFNISQAEVFQNTNRYHCHTCQSLPLPLTARAPKKFKRSRKRAYREIGTEEDNPPKKKRRVMRYHITDSDGENEFTYLITDEAIDDLIDWVAQQVWDRAGNAAHQTIDIDMLYCPFSEFWRYKRFCKKKDNFQLVSIGSVSQLIGAIKELAHIKGATTVDRWIDWITNNHRAQALKYYKFGNYVVEVETYFYYAELIGRIHGSGLHLTPVPFYYRRPIGQSSKGMIEYMENYGDFQHVVNSWLENGNPNCDDSSRAKRKQCCYMAQMSIALFLSEPTRNFRVHVTNMMQLHALKHGINGYNLKQFYNQHPMARGKAWPDKRETGMSYRKSTQDDSNGREKRKIVEGRIQSIVKSWCPLFNFVNNGHTYKCIFDYKQAHGTIISSANNFKRWKCFSYALATLGPNVLDTNNDLMTQTINQCYNNF